MGLETSKGGGAEVYSSRLPASVRRPSATKWRRSPKLTKVSIWILKHQVTISVLFLHFVMYIRANRPFVTFEATYTEYVWSQTRTRPPYDATRAAYLDNGADCKSAVKLPSLFAIRANIFCFNISNRESLVFLSITISQRSL